MTAKNKAAFETFHANNPNVYRMFSEFTFELVNRGYSKGSAHMIFHRIRWQTLMDNQKGTTFKIGNNHFPYYARLWMERNPLHKGFFDTRNVR